VIADFSASPETIIKGNTVTFTDNSVCSPDTWEWSFPGGSPSAFTGQYPPAILYETEGTYDVSLTVSNAAGSDTKTVAGMITVEPPVFLMQDGIVSACEGLFYDSGGESGYYSDGEDFELTIYPSVSGNQLELEFTMFDVEPHTTCGYDYLSIYNGESTSAALIGKYCGTDSPGTITASNVSGALTFVFHSDVSVTDPGWAANISCIAVPPVADFSASTTTPVPGSDVVFTDMSTGGPTSWNWSIQPESYLFVNGTHASSQNPEFQFNEFTAYTVTLEVSNANGTDSETKINYINPSTCTYCDAWGSNGTMEWISNVSFNTINNSSVVSSGYTDYSYITTELTPGSIYPVSVTCDMTGTTWIEHYWVFFDWNQDCDFDDLNEGYDQW
jgi:PKD repeat protein